MDYEKFLRPVLPVSPRTAKLCKCLSDGDYEGVLRSDFARALLGFEEHQRTTDDESYHLSHTLICHRLEQLLQPANYGQEERDEQSKGSHHAAFLVAYAALHAFLQANITGPPLPFSPEKLLYPGHRASTPLYIKGVRERIVRFLTVDGVAPYPLIPSVELFYLAKLIFHHPRLDVDGLQWMCLRTDMVHQRILTESAPALQATLYKDLHTVAKEPHRDHEDQIKFLLERALIHTYYGFGAQARDDLTLAAKISGFEFELTGRLGKRTKFQENDVSQLVVLARSASESARTASQERYAELHLNPLEENEVGKLPVNLELNDDTLLESVAFSKHSTSQTSAAAASLADIDPSNQPMLKPLDSLILLAYASSISNTVPEDGLTREETLPYATRVLEGGHSNWQIYTQALLVRSRIEGYRSRTRERGLLQLQALVDQVIADTEQTDPLLPSHSRDASTNTFLPRSTQGEAAPVTERLRYIHQICPPTRWELEAELAARWISLGGLKSALEIYERLQMWAEIALCYAGLDMDEKARSLIRAQLFMPPEDTGKGDEDADAIRSGRQERNILPPDAPRLFCILGDIEKDPKWYDRAWDVSGRRYPRAQRALGRYFFAKRDYAKSVEAYEKSLKVSRLDHATWFAVGSAKLQLADWPGAVDAFFPAVQLDDQDAESWSNLAAALLKRGSNAAERRATGSTTMADADEDADLDNTTAPEDPYRAEKDALKAFKRAASLRYEDWRLWENVLTVAGSMRPPAISDVIFALKRIMEIRGQSIGEKSVDEDILDRVVRHVITSHPDAAGEQRRVAQTGIQQALLDLVENNVVPLITKSRRLWQIVARVYMWLGRPASALDASEKAWRALTLSSGWESASEEQWNEVVDGTLELADAYETYGQMERTDDLGAGQGRLVASDWRFKARNAVRSIMGRGRQAWEDSSGWVRLAERQDELKRRSP